MANHKPKAPVSSSRVFDDAVEAAWVITNMVVDDQASGWLVDADNVDADIVDVLVRLASTEAARNGVPTELREQCVWALSNIATDEPEACLKMGVLEMALDVAWDPKISLEETGRLLSNLARVDYSPRLISTLIYLMRMRSDCYASQGLLEIVQRKTETLSAVTEVCAQGGITALIGNLFELTMYQPVLRRDEIDSMNATLAALGEIGLVIDTTSSYMVAAGIVPGLIHCIWVEDARICTNALWVTSNLVADQNVVTEEVMTPNMIKAVVARLKGPGSPSVLREAAWAVANALDRDFVEPFVEAGVCQALGAGLAHAQRWKGDAKVPHFKMIEALLSALQNLVLKTVYDEHVVMDLAVEQVGKHVDELATDDNKKVRELAHEFQPLMRRVSKLMTRPVGS